jgi:hypothetical protein
MSGIDFGDFGSEEELNSGAEIVAEGQYHVAINDIKQEDNSVVVEFLILTGTVDGQGNKKFNEYFNYPAASHKDGGKFCKQRIGKLLIATGRFTAAELLGKSVNFEWPELQYRQLKISVKHSKSPKKDKETQLPIPGEFWTNAHVEGLHLYGPCDAAAEHIPTDQTALGMARDMGQRNAAAPAPAAPAPAAAPAAAPAPAPAPAADQYAGL